MTQEKIGNIIDAVASFFIPGLGQLSQGRILWAFFFFSLSGLFYLTLFPYFVPIAAIFHIWSIVNAAVFSPNGKTMRKNA